MIDRLETFRRMGKKEGFEPRSVEEVDEEKVNNDRALIKNILPSAKKVIVKLKAMEANNQSIQELKQKQVQEASGYKEKQFSEEMSLKVIDNQSCQSYIKKVLDEMKVQVADTKTNKAYEGEPECRVMVGIYSALMIKFRSILREFQEVQLDYKNATQEKIRRELEIVKPDADESEINELVKDPDATSKLLSEQIIGTAHAKIRNAVEDIDQKYKDILKLEKGVEEVYQLFLDLETLIQAQGEMLDSILTNMNEAKDYIIKANIKLESAKTYHKKSRKKLCIILIVIIVVLALVILLGGGLGIGLSV